MKTLRMLIGALALMASLAFGQTNTNTQIQVLPAGAYTAATVTGPTIINPIWSDADISITVTGYSTGNYTPTVQGIDRDGTAYTVLVGLAISANGTTVLHIGNVLALPNVSAQVHLPARWRVVLTGASTPNMSVVVNANLGL